ncbi:MAG: type II toxin-antitoxin system RelE/ParE family toxin [Candidatus Sabulitectum sp.]|nr:type II toxin-antitoxin system RelE/ParE family toxin [Candidatus Sabulitectum sp.]
MGSYRIFFKRSVSKDLCKISGKEVKRIMLTISKLAENPRPPQAKKLSGMERYRLRKGSYRILYSIEETKLVICVVKIRHRRDVYLNPL